MGIFKKNHSGNATVQQKLKTMVLRPCYSKCGPRTSSIGITWKLVRDAGIWPQASPTESESDVKQICMLSAHEVREVMLQGTMFQKELTLDCRVIRARLRGNKKQEILRGARVGAVRW